MASEFTENAVKEYLLSAGGRVKNVELVNHFKKYLNDPGKRDENRDKFKNFVNTLATIKLDDNKEKLLVLKKKYQTDTGGGGIDMRAGSEPPPGQEDRPDGLASSRLGRSEDNLSTSDLGQSSSTLASTADTTSLGSTLSTSSLSSFGPDEDVNVSVVSVKERAKHLNRMESESEIQKTSSSNLAAVRKKDHRKTRDPEGDDSSTSSGAYVYSPLSKLEKDWLVKCSAAEYHLMNELLSKQPQLASVKEFTSGYTALHWAAAKGKPEVVKLLMGISKGKLDINQRTNGGYTPLHLAAIQGHEEVIQLLVQTFKADPNIRDYSGKKAKQYLRNSASTRAQRKCLSSSVHLSDSTDSPITTSIELPAREQGVVLRHKPNIVIGPPSDFRRLKNELISSPTDFRHVQSYNFSHEIGGFGPGSLRASVRVQEQISTADKQIFLTDSTETSSEL